MERGSREPSSTGSRDESGPLVQLTTETTFVGNAALIVVAGDLDLNTCNGLINATHAAVDSGATSLTLDMAGVGFIDSSGISALIEARAISPVTLRNPSDQVCRVIELTGLGSALPTE